MGASAAAFGAYIAEAFGGAAVAEGTGTAVAAGAAEGATATAGGAAAGGAAAGGAAAGGGAAASSGVLGAAAAAATATVLTSLLTPKSDLKAPGVTSATAVPLADDQAVAAAKRRSIVQQLARQGRASTILTDQSDKLGA